MGPLLFLAWQGSLSKEVFGKKSKWQERATQAEVWGKGIPGEDQLLERPASGDRLGMLEGLQKLDWSEVDRGRQASDGLGLGRPGGGIWIFLTVLENQ